jgi:hypothetical protein
MFTLTENTRYLGFLLIKSILLGYFYNKKLRIRINNEKNLSKSEIIIVLVSELMQVECKQIKPYTNCNQNITWFLLTYGWTYARIQTR